MATDSIVPNDIYLQKMKLDLLSNKTLINIMHKPPDKQRIINTVSSNDFNLFEKIKSINKVENFINVINIKKNNRSNKISLYFTFNLKFYDTNMDIIYEPFKTEDKMNDTFKKHYDNFIEKIKVLNKKYKINDGDFEFHNMYLNNCDNKLDFEYFDINLEKNILEEFIRQILKLHHDLINKNNFNITLAITNNMETTYKFDNFTAFLK